MYCDTAWQTKKTVLILKFNTQEAASGIAGGFFLLDFKSRLELKNQINSPGSRPGRLRKIIKRHF